ncbi:MAG: hypothetical protein E6J52_12930 [Chloroflexi bacterium]|nr:MAG: hypothetical protein E6J52_12930 [Chloroflexota bacterium]
MGSGRRRRPVRGAAAEPAPLFRARLAARPDHCQWLDGRRGYGGRVYPPEAPAPAVSKLDTIRAVLDDQTGGGKSAAAIPLLIPIAVACLLLLGRRRAAWLIVPALWPYSQTYYAVLALPIIAEAPLVAVALAIDWPAIVVAGLIAQVIAERLLRDRRLAWRSARAGEAPPLPSAAPD